MNSIPLTQLLTEMNDSASQMHPPYQSRCHCITDEHQAAGICIAHFIVSPDDERTLDSIDGNISLFMFVTVISMTYMMDVRFDQYK